MGDLLVLPHYDKNQLTPYYRELVENPLYGTGRPNERNGTAGTMWYGYPVNYVVANNYAGMSTATNTDNERAVDTTAGDVVADAGFGGM